MTNEELLAKYNQLTNEEKIFFYKQKDKEYKIEDLHDYCEDNDYDLTDEQIEEIATYWVENGDYDCELNYWDNMEAYINDLLENDEMTNTIIRTTLDLDELNQRAEEVFELQEGDYLWGVEVEDGKVRIEMEEEEQKTGKHIIFDYEPDMTERPEALDYLLGRRDDFND